MHVSELKRKTCCFTGHRNIPTEKIQEIAEMTAEEIHRLVINYGVNIFCVGGAIGYDTLAAKVLFNIRETAFPNVKVALIYPFDGFSNGWRKEQQDEYETLLPQYDKTICACNKPCREAFLVRDRLLVDCSAFCIAYCTRNYGGTAYTVRYAEQHGISVRNIANEKLRE